MAAEPVEHYEDPLDPQRILRELPGRERANFLAAYREALDGARDPAGWGNLRRVLRLWSGMVIATNRPGFYEAQEAALTGAGGGMLLEDYIQLRRTPGVSYRPYLEPGALRQMGGSSRSKGSTCSWRCWPGSAATRTIRCSARQPAAPGRTLEELAR